MASVAAPLHPDGSTADGAGHFAHLLRHLQTRPVSSGYFAVALVLSE